MQEVPCMTYIVLRQDTFKLYRICELSSELVHDLLGVPRGNITFGERIAFPNGNLLYDPLNSKILPIDRCLIEDIEPAMLYIHENNSCSLYLERSFKRGLPYYP